MKYGLKMEGGTFRWKEVKTACTLGRRRDMAGREWQAGKGHCRGIDTDIEEGVIEEVGWNEGSDTSEQECETNNVGNAGRG